MKQMKLDQQLEKLMEGSGSGKCGSKCYNHSQTCLLDMCSLCLSYRNSKEEEVEEYFRKKYADENIASRHFGDGGEDMSDEITQQTLLPGVK